MMGGVNAKSMSKIDHLKNLALWAAFTWRFVCLFVKVVNLFCYLVTIALSGLRRTSQKGGVDERNQIQRHKIMLFTDATLVHQNMMRGTPNGYVKEICPPKPKPALKLKKARETATTTEYEKVDSDALLPLDRQNLETSSPATPLPATGLLLLDSKRRKQNRSYAKKVAEPQISSAAVDLEKSIQSSSKKRKKPWTSLKQIADSSGQKDIGKKLLDLTIPLFI